MYAFVAAAMSAAVANAGGRDDVARIAVISAFPPELNALLPEIQNRHERVINGRTFTTGELRGKPVVAFLSGISMINAAVNAQIAAHHFHISHIVYSGVAGGVNPSLNIGDVSVPAEWANYQEQTFAFDDGGEWKIIEGFQTDEFGNFGMIFPQHIGVTRKGASPDKEERKFWFAVDAKMLAAAKQAAAEVRLARCDSDGRCLPDAPKVRAGGRGVSGSTFVNNRAYREWVWENFQNENGEGVNVLDMESAAVAAVAYMNGLPFIAFRSVSDLAGGNSENGLLTFADLASVNAAKLTAKFVEIFRPAAD